VCFGVLYTGLSVLFIVIGRRIFLYATDSKLRTSARRYRFRLYAYWAAMLGVGCFVLAYGIFKTLIEEDDDPASPARRSVLRVGLVGNINLAEGFQSAPRGRPSKILIEGE
jgi:hypothetical protein